MPWVEAAAAVGQTIGGLLGMNSQRKAAEQARRDELAREEEAKRAAYRDEAFRRQLYAQQQRQLEPFKRGGYNAYADITGVRPPSEESLDADFVLKAGGNLRGQTFGDIQANPTENPRRFARSAEDRAAFARNDRIDQPIYPDSNTTAAATNLRRRASQAVFGQRGGARRPTQSANGFLPQHDARNAGASVGRMGDLAPGRVNATNTAVDERLANLRAGGLARFNAAPTPSFGGGRTQSIWT